MKQAWNVSEEPQTIILPPFIHALDLILAVNIPGAGKAEHPNIVKENVLSFSLVSLSRLPCTCRFKLLHIEAVVHVCTQQFSIETVFIRALQELKRGL